MNKPHWPAKNLGEVIAFLSRQHPDGITIRAVSERMNITPQAVSARLKSDDASLSWVENLAQKYGYVLIFRWYVSECAGLNHIENPADKFPHARNLLGIAQYAVSYNMSINALASKLSMNYRVVERALKTGDIKISTLTAVIKKLNIRVEWLWTPQQLAA